MKNNSLMDWMENKLMPVLAKIAQNVYLQSIRDAFAIFALPVIVTGALFLIVANPPLFQQNWDLYKRGLELQNLYKDKY